MKRMNRYNFFKTLFGAFLCLVVFLAQACTGDNPEVIPEPKEESPDVKPAEHEPIERSRDLSLSATQQKLLDATVSTSFELFRIQNNVKAKMDAGELEDAAIWENYGSQNDNIVSSPLGMMYSLAMLANAAEGPCRQEIMDAMGYDGFSLGEMNAFLNFLGHELSSLDPSSRFKIAHSLWITPIMEPFVKDSFLATMQEVFGAPCTVISSISPDEVGGKLINEWAFRESEGFIDPYIFLPDHGTRILLANLLHFKAGWVWPFEESRTNRADFINIDGSISQVPMMTSDFREFNKASCDNYIALNLPYGNEAFSMIVVWPREDVELALDEICNNPRPIVSLAKLRPNDIGRHILKMPKFDLRYTSFFNHIVKDLGISKIFDENEGDFSGFITPAGQQVWTFQKADWVVQTCRISVDEKQTEAGAGSYVLAHSGPNPDPLEITLDRPFLFFISERSTGLPLFMSRVNQL